MLKYAVVKTGGKQYLVKDNLEITVDRVLQKEGEEILLQALSIFDDKGDSLELGMPFLPRKIKAKVVSHLKGEKLRIAHFKAKVRYRKVKGFRPMLSRIKIIKI